MIKFLSATVIPIYGSLFLDTVIQGLNNCKIKRVDKLIGVIQNDDDITKEQINTIDFILRFENICKCNVK